MKLGTIVELLSGVPLFSGLSTRQLANISMYGELVLFKEGDEIIEEGQAGEAGFLVISGDVTRVAGPYSSEPDVTFGAGTFIGDMAMLVDSDYSSTVKAQTNVQVVRFTRGAMRSLMESDRMMAMHFSDKISDRFQVFVEALQEFRDRFGMPEGAYDVGQASDSSGQGSPLV